MSQKILIIGGGIIGVSCAAELSRRGAQVTLIEKYSLGEGCSYGNAGWLTPCFGMPLPMPGMLTKSIKWLFDPESPLYIKPSPSFQLIKWLTQFLLSMNEKKAQASVNGLVQLSLDSLVEYKQLAQNYPDQFGFQQRGLLMVAESDSGMKVIKDEMNRVSPLGIPAQLLNESEVKSMEPALTGILQGGVFFPQEAHVEPFELVKVLAREAQKYGAHIIENCELENFEIESGKVNRVMTSKGQMSSDIFIMATGAWSKNIAKNLRLNVPILGGKGYSFVVPKLTPHPRQPIMITERKIAITPRDNSVRIAGTLELVDHDFTITQRRVNAIFKGASQHLALPSSLDDSTVWRGLRPCTPDGVPLIGWSHKIKNLMLACGHQMLGVQSATGTAKLVSDLIESKTAKVDYRIFDPNRF